MSLKSSREERDKCVHMHIRVQAHMHTYKHTQLANEQSNVTVRERGLTELPMTYLRQEEKVRQTICISFTCDFTLRYYDASGTILE